MGGGVSSFICFFSFLFCCFFLFFWYYVPVLWGGAVPALCSRFGSFGGVSWVLLLGLWLFLVAAWAVRRWWLPGGGFWLVRRLLPVRFAGAFGRLAVPFRVRSLLLSFRLRWSLLRLRRRGLVGLVGVVCLLRCAGLPVAFGGCRCRLLAVLVRLRCLLVCLFCLVARLGCGVSVGGVVAFAGSRALPASFAPLVRSVVASVVGSGRLVSVGCCAGLDSLVLSSAPVAAVRCFAAFGVGGVGACALSAVPVVSAFAAAGGSVVWWAGGGAASPLRARLAARSAAVVGAASVSCVVFFGSPASRGSLLAASLAVGRGLPVFAFACGFSGSLLPSLGAGSWVAVSGSGVWSSAWRWVSSQVGLF